jgi:hypothetical protein
VGTGHLKGKKGNIPSEQRIPAPTGLQVINNAAKRVVGNQKGNIPSEQGLPSTTGLQAINNVAKRVVGNHIRIKGRPLPSAEEGPEVSYIIKAARPIEGGMELTLNLNPRIGAAHVSKCAEGIVKSGIKLRMAKWNYYAGKTITNEDASVIYRLKNVEHGTDCIIDSSHGKTPEKRLTNEFSDKDGDGIGRLYIYDYGPGDTVVIPNWMATSGVQ